ncbi:unnamed protein product [Symbiodinium necroappetens]|uniref:Uncharacterized protein n=1 Tax=Symbiodinium necroappetens TaxID=1628268 RepID=A0A813CAQ1_9DINO|nr:unnamed protein product [Symbiodinium necroappetens]
MRVGAWVGRKLFDPEATEPPSPYLHLAKLAEIALRPLKVVMEPFVSGTYYQKNIYKRFLQRALWSPVAKQNFLAVGIPVACVVLLAGSLVSLLAFTLIILVLPAVGFRLTGIRYTLNLSLFGLFGDRFAEECEIFALVRTEAASDDFRSMRSDLKDLSKIVVIVIEDSLWWLLLGPEKGGLRACLGSVSCSKYDVANHTGHGILCNNVDA